MTTKLSPHTRISIPRADYVGTWSDFVSENTPFIPDDELTRIESELAAGRVVTHRAHTAGDFVIALAT